MFYRVIYKTKKISLILCYINIKSMISIKETHIYSKVIKEFNYSFGTIFIFDGFVISEINEGISVSWEQHGIHIVNDVSSFLGTNGNDLVYISNRVNQYSVIPSDWLKFKKNSFFLKDYYIVSQTKISKLGWLVENLFFSNKIKRFDSIYTAVNWAQKGFVEFA